MSVNTHLDGVDAVISDITDWIAAADETPLSDLGFERLQQRHETLSHHRNRCEELVRRRQAFLQESTNESVEIDIDHRRMVSYLYQDVPVGHPVLASALRLDSVCETCQRAVRKHLVRRVQPVEPLTDSDGESNRKANVSDTDSEWSPEAR